MRTRLVHIGDFHAAAGPRNADRYATLDQIITERQQDADAWIWPGDLFDGVSTPEDRNAIDDRLHAMANRAPVVIIEGNHDRRGDLRGFANLAGAHPIIVVDEQPRIVQVEARNGAPLALWCLPYPHKHGLVGAGVAHGDLSQTAERLLEAMFHQAAAELAELRAQGFLTACFFHANVRGAVLSAGQPNIGREIELSHALLDLLGPIYKGGNHIHRPQEIGGAWFAGSTARKDYGETEAKRYLVVDLTPESYAVTSMPLQIPPMFLVPGTLDRAGFRLSEGADEETERRYHAGDWTGCDVRVQASYLASERDVIAIDAAKSLFASALRLQFETIAVPDRTVRAVAVTTAKTLPDKLAAMRVDGVLPASVGDKVALLEQYDRDAVLATVKAWLASVEQGEALGAAA